MCIYNVDKSYLCQALDSLLNQTYKNIEIVCINDGSTNNIEETLNEYREKDPRIKVFSQENKGVSESKNVGIKYCTGDYITFFDSDDTCSPDTIETTVNIAEKYDSDVIINFLNARLNLKNKGPKDFSYTASWQHVTKKSFLEKHPELVFTKGLKIGEDAIYSHKLFALTDKIDINKDSVIYYRRHLSQATSIQNPKSLEKWLKSIDVWFDEIIPFYDKYNLWEKKKAHFINYIIEQPFTVYIKFNWSNSDKQYLFKKIKSIISEHYSNIDFKIKSLRTLLFAIFLKCPNYIMFELFRYISVLCNRIVEYRKIKQSQKHYDE